MHWLGNMGLVLFPLGLAFLYFSYLFDNQRWGETTMACLIISWVTLAVGLVLLTINSVYLIKAKDKTKEGDK